MIGPLPVMPESYQLYIDSFYKLGTERQIIQGAIGSIPLSKIIEYANWLDYEDVGEFISIISSLDATYIKGISDSIKKNSEI